MVPSLPVKKQITFYCEFSSVNCWQKLVARVNLERFSFFKVLYCTCSHNWREVEQKFDVAIHNVLTFVVCALHLPA